MMQLSKGHSSLHFYEYSVAFESSVLKVKEYLQKHQYITKVLLRWPEVSWALPQPPSSLIPPDILWERAVWFPGPDGLAGRWDRNSHWAPLFQSAHGEAGIYCNHPIVFDMSRIVYPRYSHAAIIMWINLLYMKVDCYSRSKPQVPQHTAFLKLTFCCVHNFLQMILLIS